MVYDAEHFFDAYGAHPDYALDCLRAAEAGGAAWITPCDTNGATLPGARRADDGAVRAALPGVASASTRTTTPSARWPTAWPPSRRARAWCRAPSTATASAAATPTSSPSSRRSRSRWASSARPRAARGAHRPQQLRGRDGQPAARRVGALRRAQRLRPQGRHAPAGDERRRAHYEHIDPERGGQRPAGAGVRAVGPGHDRRPRRASWASTSRTTPSASPASWRASRSWSTRATTSRWPTAPSSCCVERETGVYEPLFTLESFRVITEKRADGRVETEATRQDPPRRRAPGGHGRGQRPDQRAGRRAARRPRRARPRARGRSSWSTSRSASSTRPRARAR